MTMKRLAIVLILGLLQASPAWAGFREGVEAYQNRDYKGAVREFRPLADQGHNEAQAFLGAMYARGEGVPRDDAQAVKWYQAAAKQGHADAQHGLGGMYSKGRGVKQSDAEALKWFRVAAEGGSARAMHDLGLA